MVELGVNVDHVATLRQARRIREPDPVAAALIAEMAGADGITVHLREDRRHIQERDVRVLREVVQTRLNLEMAQNHEILALVLEIAPEQVTLVPERREEITTEGGLDLSGQLLRVKETVGRLQDAGIRVALFLDPDPAQIERAGRIGADAVEINTGEYSNSRDADERDERLRKIFLAAEAVRSARLGLHAGHGLNLRNVGAVAAITGMVELNIGHSIVSRALFVGFHEAVAEIKAAITDSSFED